jgi:hypothetical protein
MNSWFLIETREEGCQDHVLVEGPVLHAMRVHAGPTAFNFLHGKRLHEKFCFFVVDVCSVFVFF